MGNTERACYTTSCLAIFSCEARSAMKDVFLARISTEACSVVKARVTGTEVLRKI